MDRAAYESMARSQDIHWWFVARRRILAGLIAGLGLEKNSSILEIGCGPGGNLAMLKQFGCVEAVEYDDAARAYASTLSGIDVRFGALPDQMPFKGRKFDLICLFDVLEHIDDDIAALHAIATRANTGTRLLITVPAYQWLFSSHDVAHHHRRRYTALQLNDVMRKAGWQCVRLGYFNILLFPIAMIKRLIERQTGSSSSSDADVPSTLVNRCLTAIFSAERFWIGRALAPFGLSVVGVYRLPAHQGAD